jgi:hypothetical protein
MQQHAISRLRKLYKVAAPEVSNRHSTVVRNRQSDVQEAKNPLQFRSVHFVLLGLTGLFSFRNSQILQFRPAFGRNIRTTDPLSWPLLKFAADPTLQPSPPNRYHHP